MQAIDFLVKGYLSKYIMFMKVIAIVYIVNILFFSKCAYYLSILLINSKTKSQEVCAFM